MGWRTFRSKIILFVMFFFIMMISEAGAEIYFFKLLLPAGFRADNYSKAQEQTEWCWAASAEMALRSQGISDVSQASIVASLKGIPVNTPGYVQDVARALTGIARDRLAGIVVSQAVVYARTGNGQFVFNNSYMNGAGLAFLMAHGIPVIAFYSTGGQVGHFVLISGVSVDSNDPAKVVHYQIDDPWPLDEHGHRITGNRGVRKQVDSSFMTTNGIAFIVPIIVADTNVDHMRQFVEDSEAIARDPGSFTFMDFVQMARQSSRTELHSFNSLRDLGRNVNLSLDDADPRSFKSFAGLAYGDDFSRALEIFGEPDSSRDTKKLTHARYCNDGFTVSYDIMTRKITFVELSDSTCVDWIRQKTGDSLLLRLYGKKKSDVISRLGADISDDVDSAKYADGHSVDLEFTCYDFDDYVCNDITLHWY